MKNFRGLPLFLDDTLNYKQSDRKYAPRVSYLIIKFNVYVPFRSFTSPTGWRGRKLHWNSEIIRFSITEQHTGFIGDFHCSAVPPTVIRRPYLRQSTAPPGGNNGSWLDSRHLRHRNRCRRLYHHHHHHHLNLPPWCRNFSSNPWCWPAGRVWRCLAPVGKAGGGPSWFYQNTGGLTSNQGELEGNTG